MAFYSSALLIAIPTVFLIFIFDTYFYQQLTFVPLNFLQKNVVEDISSRFGVTPPFEYFFVFIPLSYNFMTILLVLAISYNIGECRKKLLFPHMLVLVVSYVYVFSLIAHKEDRFLLPIAPFIFLIIGNYVYKSLKRRT